MKSKNIEDIVVVSIICILFLLLVTGSTFIFIQIDDGDWECYEYKDVCLECEWVNVTTTHDYVFVINSQPREYVEVEDGYEITREVCDCVDVKQVCVKEFKVRHIDEAFPDEVRE